MKKTFIVALFLMKNRRTHYFLTLYAATLFLVSLLAWLFPSTPPRRVQLLTKHEAIDYFSTSAVVMLFSATLIMGRGSVLVDSEAEKELLLTYPLSMREYAMAQTLQETVTFASALLPVGTLLAFLTSGGNEAKAFLLAVPTLTFCYVFVNLVGIITFLTVNKVGRVAVQSFTISYACASAVHSLATGRLSPLLTSPFAFAAKPVVFCFTLTEPPSEVLLETIPLLAAATALTLLGKPLVKLVHPEHFRLPTELFDQGESREVKPVYGTPKGAIYKVVLLKPLLSRRHLTILALALIAPLILGFTFRTLAAELGPHSLFNIAISFGFLFPLVINAEVYVVSSTLAPIWLYRVNAADLKTLANAVTLQLVTYCSEVSLAFSLFLATATGRLEYLLLPLASLPAAAASSTATLIVYAYVMPKRRLVRRTEAGLTLPEEMFQLVLSLCASILVVPIIILMQLIQSGASWLPHLTLTSIALAALIHVIGVELASELLNSRDVAS
ncbi:MAG: hypothetical protein NZ954_05280 [Thermofilaceae archaeon]|nr:hypothetical protein [Thermofilaceae archaeon]MCX8181022.1 hypothetical protein [Thermofilaceae archaeon]MDW8004126.1 hypothetical protein [Thermofilaceae archaeon]